MEETYSIEEILVAVNDLRSSTKRKKLTEVKIKKKNLYNSDIPMDTLKLIEDAEKSIKSNLKFE